MAGDIFAALMVDDNASDTAASANRMKTWMMTRIMQKRSVMMTKDVLAGVTMAR